MKKDKKTIKTYFETGDVPTQQQYEDLIDSYIDSKQEPGEPNRSFVIDENGEVSVTSDTEKKEFPYFENLESEKTKYTAFGVGPQNSLNPGYFYFKYIRDSGSVGGGLIAERFTFSNTDVEVRNFNLRGRIGKATLNYNGRLNINLELPQRDGTIALLDDVRTKTINTSIPQTSTTLNQAFPFEQNPIGTMVVNLDITERYLYIRVSVTGWRKFALGEDI